MNKYIAYTKNWFHKQTPSKKKQTKTADKPKKKWTIHNNTLNLYLAVEK